MLLLLSSIINGFTYNCLQIVLKIGVGMNSSVCNILGDNIKKIRKAKNITQSQLAELLGMEVKSLSLIETGKGFISAKTLDKLLCILDVTPDELFYTHDKNDCVRLYHEILSYLDKIKEDSKKLATVNLVVKSLL